jgi:hypothetical protein
MFDLVGGLLQQVENVRRKLGPVARVLPDVMQDGFGPLQQARGFGQPRKPQHSPHYVKRNVGVDVGESPLQMRRPQNAGYAGLAKA